MKITASGQISLPADVRRRWQASRIRLVDRGDHLELYPLPDDVVATTIGRFAGRSTLSGDEMKRHDREEDDRASV
jgi:bifunctional DNA-binding transcriptional regulator/antitoxin component of YhaV-PrlF toxin-antitoxin module